MINTPVLFLIFNRPNTTKQVFEAIRKAKPKYLYISADGPRVEKPGEKEICEQIRKWVLDTIDWECEVKTLFRKENLGCGLGVSSAISWFFEHVEQGIILEDDCLPYPDFFSFCETNLEYYKNDNRIWEIAGSNFQKAIKRNNASYYFSNYGSCWGWATWARAWKNYDFNMSGLGQFIKEKKIKKIFKDKNQQQYWIKLFSEVKEVDTWDYQWLYTHWNHAGLCIVPNVNLIENIGFNNEGTHTFDEPHWYRAAIVGNGILGEIIHPKTIEINFKADDFLYNKYIKPPSFIISQFKYYINRLLSLVKKIYSSTIS